MFIARFFRNPNRKYGLFSTPQCHRRIFIPTQHCVNLGAAVYYLVLNDRKQKRVTAGIDPLQTIGEALKEARGFVGWPVDENPEFET